VHFLTSHIIVLSLLAAGCGAQTPSDVGSRVDAGTPPTVDDAGGGNPGQAVVTACPRQKSATPLLVKQLGLHPIVFRGAQTADEFITAVSVGYGYRIVGVSRCGVVRDIVPARGGAPGMTLALQGDSLFITDGSGVSAVPVTGGVPLRFLRFRMPVYTQAGCCRRKQADQHHHQMNRAMNVPRTRTESESASPSCCTAIAGAPGGPPGGRLRQESVSES
jgi:hypothetical protein